MYKNEWVKSVHRGQGRMKVSFAVSTSLKWNNQCAPASPRAHNVRLGQRPTQGERKQ